MANDNDGGAAARRRPSFPLLARTLRGALARIDAGWQRVLMPPDSWLAGARLPGASGELWSALRAGRGALAGVALATALINVLSLAGPLFMLQIYDRVL